jgi:hypothetical protein
MLVHQYLDLLSPKSVDVCQAFLETGFSIASGAQPTDDAFALKGIRRKFHEQMTSFFHLEDVMPWMAAGTPPAANPP